jgi:hypothetical protein
MVRLVLFASLLLLTACEHSIGINDADFVNDLNNTPLPEFTGADLDASMFDGATLQVLAPTSGIFLPLEDPHSFKAVILDAEGNELLFDDIQWTTNEDLGWEPTGASFRDKLDVGLHNITATAALPNGDRLVYTVGGVLVQSKFAGTYAGLFSADVVYNGITVTCSGSSVIIVEPYGENAFGEGDCLASMLGRDLPLEFIYDLDNDNGHLEGTAGANIGGWFTYDFPAEGSVLQTGPALDFAWAGHVGLGGFDVNIDAGLGADRVSRDAE